jgi:hypothetical protein
MRTNPRPQKMSATPASFFTRLTPQARVEKLKAATKFVKRRDSMGVKSFLERSEGMRSE